VSIKEIHSREIRPNIGSPKRGRENATEGYISSIYKVLAKNASRSFKGLEEDIDIC
jgi:hypothetical protein